MVGDRQVHQHKAGDAYLERLILPVAWTTVASPPHIVTSSVAISSQPQKGCGVGGYVLQPETQQVVRVDEYWHDQDYHQEERISRTPVDQ